MKTISIKSNTAEIKMAPRMSLSQVSADTMKVELLHSAALSVHTKSME